MLISIRLAPFEDLGKGVDKGGDWGFFWCASGARDRKDGGLKDVLGVKLREIL